MTHHDDALCHWPNALTRGRELRTCVLVVTAAALAVLLPAAPAGAQKSAAERPFLDAGAAAAPRPAAATVRAGVQRLRARLGRQAVVEIDPRTGTPRQVARLDGALTAPREGTPETIAREWIAGNADVLGLSAGDVGRLALARSYRSPAGVTHVTFVQTDAGLEGFNGFVRVNVAADGRVINVVGSPVPGLRANATEPRLSAAEARAAAMRDAGAPGGTPATKSTAPGAARATDFADGETAKLMLFSTPAGTRLAWYLTTVPATSTAEYVYVVDAADGRILWRDNIVDHATGLAFEYYPVNIGTPAPGHVQATKDFTGLGWLGAAATTLTGPNVHVYSDLNDNNQTDAGEEIPRNGSHWNWPISLTTNTFFCESFRPCTWNVDLPNSWSTNRAQNGTQVFYYVNNFHDWLKAAPFGFTAASGNFEGDDAVIAENIDGANTAAGLPDSKHRNNANMGTPPDGKSPRMQMYLFAYAGSSYLDFVDLNGGDEASIVYHEYGHGLSNRLVTYPSGASGLTTQQSRAMGEGWSDWYAMDYLFAKGLDAGAVNVGFFSNGSHSSEPGRGMIRTQPLNCRPGAEITTDPGATGILDDCHGPSATGNGGYTYGDYGRIVGEPETHADGEIWAQTLWQLREQLVAAHADGLTRARLLITEAMRLSPPAPSYLDMRNAILAADVAAGTNDRALIWSVFANRGMGWFASAAGGGDNAPVESFATPPTTPGVAVTGRITDTDTGAGVAGVQVGFGGHLSNLASDLAATTNAAGDFTIPAVPPGTYRNVIVRKDGYIAPAGGTLVVGSGGATLNSQLRRDWASTLAGATVRSFTGIKFQAGCEPSSAFDESLSTGWASTSDGPKEVVLELPRAVDVSRIEIDPGAVCGDDDNASAGPVRVELSKDGVAYATALTRTFTSSANHRLNAFAPSGDLTGIRFLRVVMSAPQSRTGSGAEFMDLAELILYGLPAAPPTATPTPGPGPTATPGPNPTPFGGQNPAPGPTSTPAPGAATSPTATFAASRQTLRDVLSKGLRFTLTPSEPAIVNVSVTLDPKVAKALKHRGAAGTLARSLTAKGTVQVRLSKLSSTSRKAAGKLRSVKLTITITLTNATGVKSTLRRTVTVRR